MSLLEHGRRRAVVENVRPAIDCGRFPIKRVLGERVVVEADIFADGHDVLSALVKFRRSQTSLWAEIAMSQVGNDRWRGEFSVDELGEYFYTVEAWVDPFLSWRDRLARHLAAGQQTSLELQIGARLIEAAAERAPSGDAEPLRAWARELVLDSESGSESGPSLIARCERALDPAMAELAARHPDRSQSTTFANELQVTVDPVLAQFGAWYEIFPRSCAERAGIHGTFEDCQRQLPRITSMGFDVLYLPPIHPIGRTFRKGKNNAPTALPEEVGSPWGIGSEEGGHKAIHPQLGTLEEFHALVKKAGDFGLRIALDLAFQCSPDHPYVREHPEWFKRRPDGSIQYAENPPKKYQDIYPLDFECADWRSLWLELKSVVDFWMEQGVEIFRVDNPHTKAMPFWEWLIREVRREHPQTLFLSEAFTRPKVMYHLAKIGFSQSYNYFPWRNTKWELTEYFTEVTGPTLREFFRPNLWPNTPDILPQYLQYGGRAGFMSRFILAATLGASYGIYGPAFELCESQPIEPGSEEYLNSEKYEIRFWDLSRAFEMGDLITRVNHIRKENPALQSNATLSFHPVENEQIIAYSKSSPDRRNLILVIVSLDPHRVQSGWVDVLLEPLGIEPDVPYEVHDLLSGARYLWRGRRNYVELNPATLPAHLFRVRPRLRSERDFDYFM